MVTQITLKTEGPHGLPSGRRTDSEPESEVDPLYPGLIILADYDSTCDLRPRVPITLFERSEPVRERIDS
jgi:hypothetical protein